MLMKVITTGNAQNCHYRCFNHGFKFQNSICNACRDLGMLCLDFSNITIITVKDIDYRSIIHDISQSDTIHLSENSLLHS